MMLKKMGIFFICLMSVAGLIEFSFKESAIAHIIARSLLIVIVL